MKRYFLHELKKNLLPIVLFGVIACLIYLTAVINTEFKYEYMRSVYDLNGNFVSKVPDVSYNGSLIAIPAVILCVLCTLVPIMMFAFKMNRRTVDCYYSAPIKREKLYLVRSLAGLLVVFIPYTACYWLGFLATALKPNGLDLLQFLPIYFISIPLGVLLFGVNAFAFTRANSVHDGIIFILMYAFVAVLGFEFIAKFTAVKYMNIDLSYWFTYSPLTVAFNTFSSKIDAPISAGSYEYFMPKLKWVTYLFGAVTGVACWFGLFFSVRTERAEDAEQVSRSWFGYKVLIPFFIFTILGCMNNYYIEPLIHVMVFVAGVIGYMIFRRSFKLQWQDWAVLGAVFILGTVFTLIPGYERIIF